MDVNETINSLRVTTAGLLVLSNIPCEMRGAVMYKVLTTFYHDGYITLSTVREIIYEYEYAVNPKAIMKIGPYDDLFGWARD